MDDSASRHPDSGSAIQPADPRRRRALLLSLALIAALGCAGLVLLDGYLESLQAIARTAPALAAERALTAARGFLATVAAGTAFFALVLARSSWLTVRHARHPPPGARVISATPILVGQPARRRGRLGLVLALLVLALGILVPWLAERHLRDVLYRTLEPTVLTPEEYTL